MKRVSFIISAFIISLTASAQTTDVVMGAIATPQFFVALTAGVLLALGFQVILTALSVAAGISAIGDVKETYVENKYSADTDENTDEEKDTTPTGVKISTAFGIWSTITTGLALFGATALALNLSLIESPIVNITIALSIWATFFLVIFYLEGKIASTLVGSMASTAISGLRATGDALKAMVTPSPEKSMKNVAKSTVKELRKEIENNLDLNKITDSITSFFKDVDDKIPNYDKVKKELKDILSSASSENSGTGAMAAQQAFNKIISKYESNDKEGNKDKVAQLKTLWNDLKESYGNGDGTQDTVKKVAAKVTDQDEETVQKYIDEIKNFLKNASPDGLNTEQLKKDFDKIIKNPGNATSIVADRLSQLDRESVVTVLTENTALQEEQVEKVAEQVESAIDYVKEKVNGFSNNSSDQTFMKKIEDKIAEYLNSTDRPELNYQQLKNDVKLAIENPEDSVEIAKSRLRDFDKNTFIALLTNNGLVDKKNIDQVVQTVEEAKDEVSNAISTLEDKAKAKLVNLERRAVIQAEAARKTAASAAWWLVITTIVAAGASVGGALVAF